jgi:branched-chain amino acid transport system substrate-binding protein
MAPESLADNDPVKKVVVDFAREYQKKFGEPANYFSGQQADAVALTAEGLRLAKSDDHAKLRDAIESIKNFPGCNGMYTMSPQDHHGTTMENMILLTIKDGKWHLLD